MESSRFVTWLKDHDLFGTVNDNYPFFKKILQENLGVRRQAKLLIAGDLGSLNYRAPALMMGCYLLAAKRLGYTHSIVIQEPKDRGMKAGEDFVRALATLPKRSYMTLSLSGKLGSLRNLGKSFRKFVRAGNHRFISTTGLSELPTEFFSKLVKAINVDYSAMVRKGDTLKRILDQGRIVRIITEAGTNLKIDITGMAAIGNTGVYPEFGGNLPGGEVYIPPKKGGVEGTLIIDGSCKVMNSTLLVKNPVRVRIQDGAIKGIDGKSEAKLFAETLREAEARAKLPWGIRRVAELGIGLNPNASLIGPTIINEKTLGTAHIAFGSNAWFGGSIYAITHLDQVFKNPKIWVDGKRIVIR